MQTIDKVVGGDHARGEARDPASNDANDHAIDNEQRNREHHGQNLGCGQVGSRVYAHNIQSINLFGDAHGAYFGGYIGPHLAREDEADNGAGELEDNGFARGESNGVGGNEGVVEIVGHLDCDHGAHEEGDECNDAYGVDTQLINFLKGTFAKDAPFLGSREGLLHEEAVATDEGEPRCEDIGHDALDFLGN